MNYYVTRTSNTSADSLLAAGFVVLLQQVPTTTGSPRRVTLQHRGYCYEVTTSEIDGTLLAALPHSVALHPLVNEKTRKKLSPAAAAAGYGQEMWEGEQKNPLRNNYRLVADFLATDTFNALAQRWVEMSAELQQEHIRLLLQLFSSPINDVQAAMSAWNSLAQRSHLPDDKETCTMLQVINPTAGKRANAPKANHLLIRQLQGFWLLEFLKFIGYMAVAVGFIDSVGDAKIYVPQPEQAEILALSHLVDDLRSIRRAVTPIKLDISMLLDTTELLTENYSEIQIRALEVNSYKGMERAFVLMNLAQLGLPRWPGEPGALMRVLKNMKRVIASIQWGDGKEGGEETKLLVLCRDGLSGDARAFITFAAEYGPYLMKARSAERYASQIETNTLNLAIQAHDEALR